MEVQAKKKPHFVILERIEIVINNYNRALEEQPDWYLQSNSLRKFLSEEAAILGVLLNIMTEIDIPEEDETAVIQELEKIKSLSKFDEQDPISEQIIILRSLF